MTAKDDIKTLTYDVSPAVSEEGEQQGGEDEASGDIAKQEREERKEIEEGKIEEKETEEGEKEVERVEKREESPETWEREETTALTTLNTLLK